MPWSSIFECWVLSQFFHSALSPLSRGSLVPSAIRVMSSAYLRLLIFLPAILISAYASSSPAFHMMYSAYKLNKQGLIFRTAAAKSRQSCPTLCDPIDSSPPVSAVPGILQARTLECVAISFSNAWKWKVKVKSLSHVQLIDPMDWSLPGSSVHGIFQARVLEWVAID